MMEDNVPGFIGYHITRDGKLYSRRIERSPYKFGKWHKLRLSKKARVKVKLYKDGRGYNLSISRLVALVYVYNPNPSKFNEVMHLDNNPLNNHYRNLQWGTHSMNIQLTPAASRYFFMGRIRDSYWLYLVNFRALKSGSPEI